MNINREDCLGTAKELIGFLRKNPICFHTVQSIADYPEETGFAQLHGGEKWGPIEGGSYYMTRNGSPIVSSKIPGKAFFGFQTMASRSDSPSFKIRENPEVKAENHYVELNVEEYGDMLCTPWFDCLLSVAGRLAVKEGDRIAIKPVKIDRDLLMILNLAIYFNREANEGYQYNAQADMLPLRGGMDIKGIFMETVAESAGVKKEDILGHDLYLYNRMSGGIQGADGEFLSCGHLGDLQCAFSTSKGFSEDGHSECVSVYTVPDNEEIGSLIKQGVNSAFLEDVLRRINSVMGRSEEEYLTAIASSFMVSAGNAHVAHPNHGDKSDPINRPYTNEGIVIKYSTKYATDGLLAVVFRALCQEEGVPYQAFTSRSGKAGSSTLGSISNSHVVVNIVDIGLPQLSMHSPYETVGIKDACYLIQAVRRFYSTSMRAMGSGSYEVR